MQHVKPQRRGRSKRFGSFFLAVVMALAVATSALPLAGAAVTKDQINSLKAQAADLSNQKAGLQKDINKLSRSKNAALDKKILLEQKINVLQAEIAVSEQAIANYSARIVQKEDELKEAEKKEQLYFEKFCERVRSMEEDGDETYWSVLFQANSFSDLLDRMNLVSEVMDYDNEVMDELAEARQAVADAKKELEESKAGEEAVRQNLGLQKSDLGAEQQQVLSLIGQINNQSAVYAKQIQKLEDSSNSVEKELARAQKEYAAQIEAQRKAEAERKAKEAAARKAAQEAAAKKAAAEKAAREAAAKKAAAEKVAKDKAAKEAAEKAAREAAAKKKAAEEAAKKAAEEAAQQALQQQQNKPKPQKPKPPKPQPPQPQPPQPPKPQPPAPPQPPSTDKGYMWPLPGYTRISSRFGWRTHPLTGRPNFHGGVDIPAPAGTPIRAAKGGVVLVSKYNSSYGNYVSIAHPDGITTLYAHMSSRAVSPGATVSQGQVIGYVGTTGSSSGNHLHFETRTGSSSSSRVNPMQFF